MRVPSKQNVMSSGRTAVDGAIGGAVAGLAANLFGGEIGVLLGGILAGAVVGGSHGEMITINATQDAVAAMMMGGMGDVGSGGAVM